MQKWVRIVSVATIVSLVLTATACKKTDDPNADKEQIIRIADDTGMGEDYTRQQFTDLFEYSHPKTKIEYTMATDDGMYRYNNDPQTIVDPLENLKKIMTGSNPPDLVHISPNDIPNLIDENLLAPLDPLAQRDQFDLNKIVPSVREGLKTMGDGKLYALAPTFTGNALAFNKKIFTDAGVPFPKDGMTWDDIFNLARRVAHGDGKERTFGLALGRSGEIFYDMNAYTSSLGLNMVDDTATTMTVDSSDWENVWKTLIKNQKDKIMTGPMDYSQMNPNPFFGDPFMSGQAAMMVVSNADINNIVDANKNASKIKNFKPFDWDVVTLPTHPDAPGIGSPIYLDGIFAINVKAQNQEGAWQLLKFINGDDWAKLRSRNLYQLVSRQEFIKPISGANYNVKAFYTLTPSFEQNNDRLSVKYPNIYSIFDIGRQKLQLVIEGKKEVRQALKEWQTEGNQQLKTIKTNTPNNPMLRAD